MEVIGLCDECPWPGKCTADEFCWLEVDWNDEDLPEAPDGAEDPGPEEDA